jgi:protein tyrosine phosphatase (PTP) superfamily phosphohydrolase (DUF442 family)
MHAPYFVEGETMAAPGGWGYGLGFALMLNVSVGGVLMAHALAAPANSGPLENVRSLSSMVYSGGEPVGDAAFAKLAEMGIRTIVSVDGIRPDIDGAKKHGLRYIHIPVGYEGVNPDAQASLTRVVRDIAGPVFIHCHHGKHRGPAAAAVACMAAGDMTSEQALEYLKGVGTGQEYQGLWADVREFKPLAADAKLPELVEAADVHPLAAAMSALDRPWDAVKVSQAAGWKPGADPAKSPVQQAVLLWEGLRESKRTLDGTDETLGTYMDEAIRHAAGLRQALEASQLEAATAAYKKVEASCAACHVHYRN